MKKIIRELKQEDHSKACALVALCSISSDDSGRKGLQREVTANPVYTESYDNEGVVCTYYKRKDLKESGWHGELVDYVTDTTFEEVGATLKEVRYIVNRVIKNRYAPEPTKLITELKNNDQDFEFYPTKPSMLQTIKRHLNRELGSDGMKILDIGAGRAEAGVLLAGESGEVHCIEKSSILTAQQPAKCVPVGVDFMNTTLIDKDHYDGIFCNPPYKTAGGFAYWMEKIIREARADFLYFVVPRRWEKNETLQLAVRDRKATYKILAEDDFLDAERSARAKIHIVMVDLMGGYRGNARYFRSNRENRTCKVDPFNKWLRDEFGPAADPEPEDPAAQETRDDLVNRASFAKALVETYNAELARTGELFKSFSKFTASELQTLLPDAEKLLPALREKLIGLKSRYWKRLFDRYKPINTRLTGWSKRELQYKLTGDRPYTPNGVRERNVPEDCKGRMNLDFNAETIHAVTAWVLRQSNTYFDDQAVTLYDSMLNFANIVKFKSNHRVFKKENFRWQMHENPVSHVTLKLDVRFILENKGRAASGGYDYSQGLHVMDHEFLEDLRAVAYNLGFICEESSHDKTYKSGQNTEFKYPDGTIFLLAKPHLSGTLHLKCDQKFLKAWTILVSGLTGWVKSPEEFHNEVDGYTSEDTAKYWKSNYQITSGALLLT